LVSRLNTSLGETVAIDKRHNDNAEEDDPIHYLRYEADTRAEQTYRHITPPTHTHATTPSVALAHHDGAVENDAEGPKRSPHAFVALPNVAEPASCDDEGEEGADVGDPVPADAQPMG